MWQTREPVAITGRTDEDHSDNAGGDPGEGYLIVASLERSIVSATATASTMP